MPSNIVEGFSGTTKIQSNILFLLRQGTRAKKNHEITPDILDNQYSQTYDKLLERVNKVANKLRGLGNSDEDVVGVYRYSTFRYIELLYTASSIETALFAINYEAPPKEQRYMFGHINKSPPLDLLFLDREQFSEIEEL